MSNFNLSSPIRAHKGADQDMDTVRIKRIQEAHRMMEYPWPHGDIISYSKNCGIYHVTYSDGTEWDYAASNGSVSYKQCQPA